MRLTAPIVVVSTVVVFATGVVLMIVGPGDREPSLLLHKASFVVWLGFTAVHVLGHLPELIRSLRAAGPDGELRDRRPVPPAAGSRSLGPWSGASCWRSC